MPVFKTFKTQVKKLAKLRDHAAIADHILDQALTMAWTQLEQRKINDIDINIAVSNKQHDNDKHDQSVLTIVAKDMPFLIDSVVAACVDMHFTIEGVLHHTVLSKRDKQKKLQSIAAAKDASKTKDDTFKREAIIIITLQGLLGEERQNTLKTELCHVINDVDFATQDWLKMRDALQDTIAALENTKKAPDIKDFEEYQAFLNYIHDNNFTLLGYREYSLSEKGQTVTSHVLPKKGLGLLSDAKKPVFINATRDMLPKDLQKQRVMQKTLSIAKVNKNATVHRRVPMDAIAIKTYDDKGNINGERLFIGLFTSVTYSRSIQDIPYLRSKINAVVEKSKYSYNSHNYRALMHILEKYPRDELFQIDVDLLLKYSVSIMALQEQPKVALYVREDVFKRYASCLVYIPRDKYETDLRLRIQTILEQSFGGTCEGFNTVLDDSPLARVIYRIPLPETKTKHKYDYKAIEAQLVDAARSWPERLSSTLLDQCDTEKHALALAAKYAHAFPAGYRDQTSSIHAYNDITKLETLSGKNNFSLDLYHAHDGEKSALNLKIYHWDTPVILSDILPILENFGFAVIAEDPHKITFNDGQKVWIHDFQIQFKNPDHAQKAEKIKAEFESALTAIWTKKAENDTLNALTAKANMPWRDVVVLRALIKYMRQTSIQYTPQYMMGAVSDHPEIAALLVDYFTTHNEPNMNPKTQQQQSDKIVKSITKKLMDVASYDQDRILRSMLQIMQAMLRTNFFQNKDYISFKLDSKNIDILPLPKPHVEIFVYSPRVEGVHLRGGKVARGGLRWSDRHEDFRTEILGLMKAQNVKNAVIIPVGSKGGFVVKHPPKTGGRDAFIAEGIACYKIFISGLLDITDNIDGDKIIPPADVVRHDEDDPYLVVAADKGTATFSDIANGISADYGFWLGDAFASGGSAGYDHKVMGITARGAWESVKRHFRELGTNIQETPFNVIGVGDMGGDVFGNGMLLSPQIRLVGAFNHLHIFCDPNPDIEKSFKERERLFKDAKGWDAYDESILSKGGKIYSRSDKSLKLTPEIQERFGLSKKEVSPLELMNAMLRAETDLLWFGGIGTYIKAPNEANADVGDKANDAIRIDAHEVRAKVIGEGANLGTTHSARIAMSLLGIKCYADFIDNSGGVNSSDLEVNIKILFQQIMQSSKLTVKQRNTILGKMTDDVADLVLRNNYQQTQAISFTAYNAYDKLNDHATLIDYLEQNFNLDRKIEFLPSASAIDARAKDHKGLCAPELSTLISYTKIKLFQDLVDSNLPDDPAFQSWMKDYFPPLLQKKYSKEMDKHRLRREIIATQLANSIVNRMGPTYVMNQSARTGVPACTVARVYFTVREVFDLKELYDGIESLDNKADARVQIEALQTIADFIDYGTTWFLKHYRAENLKENELIQLGDKYKKSVVQLLKSIGSIVPQSTTDYITERESFYRDNGFAKDSAHKLALLPVLNTACDIIRISHDQKQDLNIVAKVYFGLNEALSFVWLRENARGLEPNSRWEADTLKGVIDRLYVTQAELTKRIVATVCQGKKCPADPVAQWLGDNKQAVSPLLDNLEKITTSENLDFAMLTSIEVRLEQLV